MVPVWRLITTDCGAVLMTPLDSVIVVPSTWTMPFWEEEPCCTAGAPSERMKVVATPLTAVGPAVAVGFAPVEPEPPQAEPVPLIAPEELT